MIGGQSRTGRSAAPSPGCFAVASKEVDEGQKSGIYDEIVVNDELERAIAETLGIVERERAKRAPSG